MTTSPGPHHPPLGDAIGRPAPPGVMPDRLARPAPTGLAGREGGQQHLAGIRPAGRSARALRRRSPSSASAAPGGIILPFLVLFIVLSVASGPFFTKTNLLDILDHSLRP